MIKSDKIWNGLMIVALVLYCIAVGALSTALFGEWGLIVSMVFGFIGGHYSAKYLIRWPWRF